MHRIRLARADDADALLAFQHSLDTQSAFMLLEPGERGQMADPLRVRLQGHTRSFDLIAENGDARRFVGWLSVEVLPFRRARYTGYMVLGVDSAAAGHGIGRDLLKAAEHEARARGLRRLELTVMSDNLRALDLYLRSGFQVEGLRREALVRDATFIDEYYMGKLLPVHERR